MNKLDTLTKNYLNNNARFAELFNVFVFKKNLINPDELYDQDSSQIQMDIDKSVFNKKYRDNIKLLKCMTNNRINLMLLSVENQSSVNYAMPVRVMEYDGISYNKQVQNISKKAIEEKVEKYQIVHGIPKGTILAPVITLVIYWSPDKWDGPRDLFGLLDKGITDEYGEYLSNYKMNLICPYEMSDEEISKLHTDLYQVMTYIKNSNDKHRLENIVYEDDKFKSVSKETVELIKTVTKSKIKYNENEEEIDMCKAIEDMRIEARDEGIIQGKAEGILQGKAEGILQGKAEGLIIAAVSVAMDFGKTRNEAIEYVSEKFGKTPEEVKEYLRQS